MVKGLLDSNPKTRLTLSQIKGHEFILNQKIPPLMPPYTISLPPQNSFLKQYGSEKGLKLAIYPRKVSSITGQIDDICSSNNLKLSQKLSRVLSCDKNVFKLASDSKNSLKDHS